jgi:hypothetical protein
MSEVETNPTLDFVNALQGEDYNDAEKLFNGILGDKLQQSLDAEKVAVADSIFNGVESEDVSIDDEDLDAELTQMMNQEETVD